MSSNLSIRARFPECRLGRCLAAVICLPLLAGCSTMNLLEGKLPIDDEENLGIVTRPYPDWEVRAKETLSKIPTAEAKKQAAATPAATLAAAAVVDVVPPGAAISNENTTVTHEQSPAANPATTTPAPVAPLPAQNTKPIPAAAPKADATPIAAAKPSLARPTQEHSLAVTGAESAAGNVPAANSENTEKGKAELTSAERLSTLMKQRSEFLSALKAEVIRRRAATEDNNELRRLEQELRLVQLAGEQPEEAVRQIEALEGPERDAFAHLLMGLATWMNADEARRPTLRNAKIVREIRDAAAELAAASKLDVRNLAFCEKVESYGWYTEFPRSQFKPKQQVILYAEVENFSAIRIADDSFETELQGSYQIFDSRGSLVDERELPLDKEVCRNYRRDYFLAYLIYLPEGLSSGNYRLELTIEDKKGSAAHQEPEARRGVKEDKLAKTPNSASSYKGRKLGTGTIEFTIK